MNKILTADYLIVGGGASGLAFADTLLAESDATMIIVDNRHKPGGHWNDAYSFVTLHQPSSFYGVQSTELSQFNIDKVGLNKDLHELASGAEVQAYFDKLMQQVLLPSGRVQYLPFHEYIGNGEVKNLINGDIITVEHNKKLVDSTYYKTKIPSTHTPGFSITDDVDFCPPNALPNICAGQAGKPTGTQHNFVIIGGGKTAIDTCLWLLTHSVSPERITWIMPRDAWLLDRKNTQASDAFFKYSIGAQASQLEAIASSQNMHDMFLKLEEKGYFLRIDKNTLPTMFHGATVSQAELNELRKIKNIVRKGRITDISQQQMTFQHEKVACPENALFVDCSASAISNLEITPIFQNDMIKLQTVRAYQPLFSASFIAHIEINYKDEKKKNNLCRVVPLPNTVDDWIELTYQNMMNQFFWSKEPGLKTWLINNRLDGFMKLVNGVKFYQIEKIKILNRMRLAAKPAITKLKTYREQIRNAKST